MTELPVSYKIVGEVYLVRNGVKKRLLNSMDAGFVLKDGDRLITENGYAIEIRDGAVPHDQTLEAAWLMIYPHSEAVLSIKVFDRKDSTGKVIGHMIERIELVRGMFWVQISTGKPIGEKLAISPEFPQIEIKPLYGDFGRKKEIEALIDLKDGAVNFFDASCRILHKGTGLEARLGGGGAPRDRISVGRGDLYAAFRPDPRDPRIEKARRLKRSLLNGEIVASDKPLTIEKAKQILFEFPEYLPLREEDRIMERKGVQRADGNEEQQLDEYWNRQRALEGGMLERRKILEAEYKKKLDAAKTQSAYDALMKEMGDKNHEDYLRYCKEEKKVREDYSAKEVKLIEDGRKGITGSTAITKVGRSTNYRSVEFGITTLETGIERGLWKSPAGKEFLIISFDVTNKGKQLFFDPDREFSLVVDGNELVLQNYKLETNMDAGYRNQGHFFFIVPEGTKKFTLIFGKKSAPDRVSMDLSL